MRKTDELMKANSCLNKAKDGEMVFVLLGRDIAAPEAIRFWAKERVWHGKNTWNDPQIVEALECADTMEKERNKL